MFGGSGAGRPASCTSFVGGPTKGATVRYPSSVPWGQTRHCWWSVPTRWRTLALLWCYSGVTLYTRVTTPCTLVLLTLYSVLLAAGVRPETDGRRRETHSTQTRVPTRRCCALPQGAVGFTSARRALRPTNTTSSPGAAPTATATWYGRTLSTFPGPCRSEIQIFYNIGFCHCQWQ